MKDAREETLAIIPYAALSGVTNLIAQWRVSAHARRSGFVEVINPDGVPGSGDERFRTLSSGGSKIVVGSADARKDKLDTVFKTALVIKF